MNYNRYRWVRPASFAFRMMGELVENVETMTAIEIDRDVDLSPLGFTRAEEYTEDELEAFGVVGYEFISIEELMAN